MPAKGARRDIQVKEAPGWGIEPVPERLRVLGSGFHGKWLWTIVVGAVAAAFALLGPIGFVRRWVRRFALWAVLASLGYLTWWAVDGASLGTLWHQGGSGGLTFAQGIDLTI